MAAVERLDVILTLLTGNYKKEARDAAVATGQVGTAAQTSSRHVGILEQNTMNVGKAFKSLATGALLGVVAGLATVIGDLDKLGQKMESTERMAETVFGNMVASARKWADDNNEAFGIGESAMLSLISKTQDLLVPMGFARDAAFDMSKEILNTANALSEWEGGTITAEDAQLRLAKAMLGEREGLVELGVKITDQEVKTRLAAKGLDKLTGAARQQAIAQVTLELVMGKSTDALAAYEDRAGTATAAQKDLAASTADTAESWAELLRGPLDTAKGTLADVTEIAEFLSEKMAENAGKTDDATESTSGLVQLWGTSQPIMAAFMDILGWTADQTNTVEGLKNVGKATEEMVPKVEAAIEPIEALSTAQRLAGDATRHHFDALVSLANFLASRINPVLAAKEALENLAEAQETAETAAREHGRESDEFALSQIELALAVAEAEVAFGTFGVNVEDSIDAVAQALGISNEAARIYMETLGLLDGMEVTSTIILRQINLIEEGVIPEGLGPSRQTGITSGRASGGLVTAGQPYLVGERGAEMFIPQQSGSIVSNQALGRGGGSLQINVQSPMREFRSDLQYAALIASVTNLVEGF